MRQKPLTVPVILRTLKRIYHPPQTFLRFRTPLDLLVVTILSAQCTDARVNAVSKELFRTYKRAEDYVRTPRRELERAIRPCGFFHAKAKHIQSLCRMLLQKYRGQVPRTMDELTELPGVGRKTAAIILYACFGKNEGIAVDTHVLRLARRLGLTKEKRQEKIELDLMKHTPRREWGKVTTLLISHGRAICTARDRKCSQCVFKKTCPSSRVMGRRDLAQED